jgi:cytoskeletal protein CcmA (bactofilin family)
MFSKKPGSEIPAATASRESGRKMGRATFSVLGADIAIRGDIAASADLHIDGRVEGDIVCAALVQGESSEIVGTVTAEAARLGGRIRGTIAVRELVILKSARIEGDVHYDALTIEPGASVDGRLAPRSRNAGDEHGETHLVLASSHS